LPGIAVSVPTIPKLDGVAFADPDRQATARRRVLGSGARSQLPTG
jgi:hypothetical protein